MKKKLLALGVASVIGGFALNASAVVVPGTGTPQSGALPANNELGLSNATALEFNPDGIGHILVVPYYSAQGGNATMFNLVNTDTVNGKLVKVRFRGALNSDDVLDFQVFLSPGDVWAATVSQGADGRATLTTTDNTVTLPGFTAGVPQPFITDRLPGSAAEKAAGTLEGYVEIFNVADIPPRNPLPASPSAAQIEARSLYASIKHRADGSVLGLTTTQLARLAIDFDGGATQVSGVSGTATLDNSFNAEQKAAFFGLATPTTGLAANWTIINVPNAAAWSGTATAVEARLAGNAARGNFVWFPQNSNPLIAAAGNIETLTADPLLRYSSTWTGAKTPLIAQFDLPDLSTPYVAAPAAGAPEVQASLLTSALAVTTVANEFVTDPGIFAATDWVFSMPTRRYSVAVDYSGTDASGIAYTASTTPTLDNSRLIFNVGVGAGATGAANPALTSRWFVPLTASNSLAIGVVDGGSVPVIAAPNVNVPVAYAGQTSANGGNVVRVTNDGIKALTVLGGIAVYDRSERTPTAPAPDFGFSPGTPAAAQVFSLPGEASVLQFGGGVLNASIATQTVNGLPYVDGWARIATGKAIGLPVLGQAFLKASHPAVSAGTAANFGASYDHKFQR